MKEYTGPKKETQGLSSALIKICERVSREQNYSQAIVVLPRKKGAKFDIRLYNPATHELSDKANLVAPGKMKEALDKLVLGGQPVLRVVRNKNGTHTVWHVDTKSTPYYVEAPDGVYDELKVDF